MKRIKTFIEGFDEILHGGIPLGHVVLISGEPGTLKSSLAYSILHHNALTDGNEGLYITLEQGRKSLIEQMYSLGMDYENVKDKIGIIDFTLIRKKMKRIEHTTWLPILKLYISAMCKKNKEKAKLFVLDSLSVMEQISKMKDIRIELFHLFGWLRETDVTSFIVIEKDPDSNALCKHGEDFLADGIIYLKNEKVDAIHRHRTICCLKLRSTHHSTDELTLLAENAKFQVTRTLTERARI
ncbi:MAG: ATPase domain-containing protein [Candidatus Thermoplasmatota archaeon]